MDLELKDQKLSNLNRELHEITFGGTTEEEVTRLRKIKHDLENKIAEQVRKHHLSISIRGASKRPV